MCPKNPGARTMSPQATRRGIARATPSYCVQQSLLGERDSHDKPYARHARMHSATCELSC